MFHVSTPCFLSLNRAYFVVVVFGINKNLKGISNWTRKRKFAWLRDKPSTQYNSSSSTFGEGRGESLLGSSSEALHQKAASCQGHQERL
jgi:hypothetical protein